MRVLLLLLIGILAFALAGCTSTSDPQQHLAANQDACWVCVNENDLACIKVDVDEKTPTAVYNGKTYHFCSEQCKKEFQANPAKFEKLALKGAPQTQPAHH
jgi:YHS domain-containing protein